MMTEFNHAGDCSIYCAGSHICDCGEFRRAMPEIDVLDDSVKELLVAHQCQLGELTDDYHVACRIKKAYSEYMEMLNGEIDSLVWIAHVHGWVSKNIERGRELREKIKEVNKLIE